MQSDYTFLTDHSYSIRIGYDKLPLKQREIKSKKRRGNYKNKSTNRTVSIDRSSSDKENNSSIPITNTSGNRRNTPMKKKTAVSNKKPKSKVYSNIGKSNKKPLKSRPMDISDAPPSLSIEERVKLRRTKPLLAPVKPLLAPIKPLLAPIKPLLNKKQPIKRIHSPKSKKTIIKPKKFFLGSGLDLDNIVLGNRQRRSVQT